MLANTKAGHEAKPRMSGGERRAQIVRTAFDLFARDGFRGTTTRELASAVGVSEPVLYQHFANKKELYTAIVQDLCEHGMEQFGDRLEAALREEDERACLQRLGELVLSWYVDDPRLIRLLLFSALEGHELAEIWYGQAFAIFFRPFIEKLERTAEAGRLKDVGSEVLARAFVGMMGHYGMVTAVFKYPELRMSHEEAVSKFVEIFLSGAGRR
jgi:AcrR family transcriptional regulator